jgi:hypothetical protein
MADYFGNFHILRKYKVLCLPMILPSVPHNPLSLYGADPCFWFLAQSSICLGNLICNGSDDRFPTSPRLYLGLPLVFS